MLISPFTLVGDGERRAELLETKKALSRKAIEHLGYIQDISSLAVLSSESDHPHVHYLHSSPHIHTVLTVQMVS